jgi:serpin B
LFSTIEFHDFELMKKILLVISVIFLFGCSKKVNVDRQSDDVISEIDEMVAAENFDIVDNNNDFAFEIYRRLSKKYKENVFFSPYSISTALAMTYAGAREETEKQMQQTMNFGTNNQAFHAAFKALNDKILYEPIHPDIVVKIANALWAQEKYPFVDEFYEMTRDYYRSGFHYVDFKHEPDKARREINEWVEKQTYNKIIELLAENQVTELTRMVLVNAIYFKGRWTEPFNRKYNEKDEFTLPNKTTEKVWFMNHYKQDFNFFENELMKMVMLPYYEDKFSMLVILPANFELMDEVEKQLHSSSYNIWTDSLKKNPVNVKLPKFRFSFGFKLKQELIDMGMPIVFTDEADFSGMSNKNNLKIDDVLHEAYVEVNERGTEAAASTAVLMLEKAATLRETKEMIVNRPFIFLIRENKTNSILFLGRINKPDYAK